jgi:hypothetical protein
MATRGSSPTIRRRSAAAASAISASCSVVGAITTAQSAKVNTSSAPPRKGATTM